MVFLRSLRNSADGRYHHSSLDDSIGPDAADRTLRHHHHQIFAEWLRLSLAEQKEEIEEFLRISGTAGANLPYRELPPASAHEVERQLYLTDLEVVLQLISFEPGALFVPGASPRR